MGEQGVHPIRRVFEWLSAGRAAAEPLIPELIALPEAQWDEWLEAHPAARTVQLFEGILDVAEREPRRTLAATHFVIRHSESLPTPPGAAMALTFLRGHAWRVRAFALLRAGDAAAALRAWQESAAIFGAEPLAPQELEAVRRQAAGSLGADLVAGLLRNTPFADWPRLAARPELHSTAALAGLSLEVASRVDVVPLEALTVAEIAAKIADALPTESLSPAAIAQARAQAWKDRALVLGVLARYADSLAALDRAEEILGPFPDLENDRAVVRLGRAGVLSDSGRLKESMAVLEECKAVFEKHGDARRTLLSASAEGALFHRLGRYDQARAAYSSVLHGAEIIGDEGLLASLHNNLAHTLIEMGDFEAAAHHLDQAAAVFSQMGQPLRVARSELARGRMLIRKGENEAAITHLHSVRSEFLAHNLVEEAGLCGLDIVEAHLRRGASIEAEAFAHQVVREFTAAHLNSRAITALGYLSEAIAAREASAATVRKVGQYIRSLRGQPNLDFADTA